MNRLRALVLVTSCLSSVFALGQEGRVIDADGQCFSHEYQSGEIVRLNITTFADLRIQMPFPIYTAKLGGGQLWQATFTRGVKHIWLKAKSEAEEGAITSLTVLDNDLNAYDFVITRVSEPGYICAVISLSQDDQFLSDLSEHQTPEQQEVETLRRQLANARQEYQANLQLVKEHAENVISASQAAVYAGYTWSAQQRGEESERIAASIQSVHDDGFLTFVNVKDPSVGVLSIQGSYGDQTQVVQVDYNPLLAMYTITGVYSRLVVNGEHGSVEIIRGAQ